MIHLENPLQDALETLKKDKRFSDKIRVATEKPQVKVLPTGVEELDSVVLGLGGLPRGKIVTLWGPYMCGKSTLVAQIIANMHKNNLGVYGGTVALFDSEDKFDSTWWEEWGVDMNRVLLADFDCGEEAFDQMMLLFGKVDVIVLDSIATLSSKEKATRGSSKIRMGAEARMISEKIKDVKNGTFEINKTTGTISKPKTPKLGSTDTILIVINQVRANIGVMFSGKDTLPGGNINKHLQSVLVRMDIIGYGKDRDNYGGIKRQKIRMKCERNHYAPPFRSCDVWLDVEKKKFETVNISYILNIAIDKGLVKKKGSWLNSEYFPNGKLQGTQQFVEFLASKEGEEMRSQLGIEAPQIEEEDLIIDEDAEENKAVGEGLVGD